MLLTGDKQDESNDDRAFKTKESYEYSITFYRIYIIIFCLTNGTWYYSTALVNPEVLEPHHIHISVVNYITDLPYSKDSPQVITRGSLAKKKR